MKARGQEVTDHMKGLLEVVSSLEQEALGEAPALFLHHAEVL